MTGWTSSGGSRAASTRTPALPTIRGGRRKLAIILRSVIRNSPVESSAICDVSTTEDDFWGCHRQSFNRWGNARPVIGLALLPAVT